MTYFHCTQCRIIMSVEEAEEMECPYVCADKWLKVNVEDKEDIKWDKA
ncbi:hypothetical protein [Peribacillus loiseleuriae]